MKPLKAHVVNGQIVLDEPAQLPEGAVAEVHLLDEISAAERVELDAALDDSARDFERGDFADAREFARRLASKP